MLVVIIEIIKININVVAATLKCAISCGWSNAKNFLFNNVKQAYFKVDNVVSDVLLPNP